MRALIDSLNFRFGLANTLLVWSAVVFASHWTGSIFPWMPIGLLCAAVIVLVSGMSVDHKVVLAALASSGYAAYTFWFTWPVLLNMDPDKVAVAISRVMEVGGSSGISSYYFYSRVPAFHLFVSSVGILSGLSGKEALIVFGVVTPLLQVLGAAALVGMLNTDRARTYAIVLSMVSTSILYYAVAPIPQLAAVALWMPFLLMFDRYVRTRSRAHLVGLVVIVTALTYTHKSAMVVALGAVLGAALVYAVKTGSVPDIRALRPYATLSIVVGFLLGFQSFWITTYGSYLITSTSSGLFDGQVGAPDAVDASTYLAVPPLPRLQSVIVGNADWVLLTAAAGVCWLVVLWSSSKRLYQHTMLLGTALWLGALLVIGYVVPENTSPRRLMLFATIPFAAAIGVAFSDISTRFGRRAKHGITLLLFVLLVSQLAVTGAAPDHPYEPREYLAPAEVDGKQWTSRHTTQEVHADFFYAREIVDFDRPGQTYVTGPGAASKGYDSISGPYLNGTVVEQGYPYVLYRTEYDRYQIQGIWVLTWDPETEFDAHGSRVFDNGDVILYRSLK